MKTTMRKIMAMVLAVMMTVSCMTVFAQASESDTENGWLGDGMVLDIEPGKEPYVYAIAQDPDNNRWYYETSNHTVKKEVTGGGAIHIFPIVDSTKLEDGVWTPDGIYNCGTSNYDVMYCCDSITGTDNAIYYKRVNLEDSEYVTDEQAKKLRAIVTNAYPYVSVDEAKAALKAAGFAQADELDRSELITATQAAVWSIANKDAGDSYRYNKTATTAQKLTWGGYMHEFANEIANFTDSTAKRKYYSNPNGTGDRINALIDFYLAMEGVEAPENQIVITDLEIVKSVPSVANDGTYSTTLRVVLNSSGSSEKDSIKLDIYVDDIHVKTEDVVLGTTGYEITVDAKVGRNIKAVVSGTQDLPRGVYFYIPRPEDLDGDGVATSREVSQNLIGVAEGVTEVYADAEVTVPNVTELTVNKTWNDGDNRDGIRPEEVTVRLLADGAEVDHVVLNAENDWTWTFENIPVVNESGNVIDYTVTEDAVAGYEAVIEEYSVTNVHQPELTLVEVKKTWNDGDDRDALRPDEITVRLHANGQEIASQILNEENGWAVKFEDLFKFENGEEIVYTITEDTVENYTPTITETENGFAIENYYKPETTFVNVAKTWNDEDDRDGKRPESVTIVLLADGEPTEYTLVLNAENEFTGTFVDLPVNNAGKKIEYTVAEIGAAPYVSTVEGDSEAGFKVTNTYAPEKITVNGTKTWVDEDDADGIRPESITINLLANGTVVDTKVVTEADGWAWTFEDLYKYENGEEIEYTITEDSVEGYETVVDGYNVTNTHEVEEEIEEDPVPLTPADKKPEEKPEVKPEKEEIVEIEDEEIPLAPNFTAPQTGDTSSLFAWLAVAVVTGTLFLIVNRKLRRTASDR